jgi:hypothetical protein
MRKDRCRRTDGVRSGRAGLIAVTGDAPWLSSTCVECGAIEATAQGGPTCGASAGQVVV